ncbi:DUF4304 domain-containing protein [Aquincola sp. S2]|uniref:DUF4304 domain-containing protein n=1 Tax=Pseudaquabacterium terrae TaxID=2732868 RepID=A0ABX2EUM5_9BURK|nr:DUF4304 domain-containing protein [Aquabacterium terrae]
MNRTAFFALLSKRLLPILRAEAFRGSSPTLRRVDGVVVHVFNVQSSAGGACCYLNLGAHLAFLPTAGPTDHRGPMRLPGADRTKSRGAVQRLGLWDDGHGGRSNCRPDDRAMGTPGTALLRTTRLLSRGIRAPAQRRRREQLASGAPAHARAHRVAAGP